MALHLNEHALVPPNNNNNNDNIKIVYREAQVISVFDDYFDVMIPELNMERRIHLANLPVWRSELDTSRRALTMFWKKGMDTSTGKQSRWSLSDDEYEDLDEDCVPEIQQEVSPPPSSKSSKRQSIIQARLSNSTSFSPEQSSQTIQALDKIRVILTIEVMRTSPLIRVLAANPYA
jgi:protein SSD1